MREAITIANAVSGSQTITFHTSLEGGLITLVNGALPTITDELVIDGNALSDRIQISAAGNDSTPGNPQGDGSRIFYIDDGSASSIQVELQGLVLTNADSPGNGGAIYNVETLTITDSAISGNSTAPGYYDFTNVLSQDSCCTSQGGTVRESITVEIFNWSVLL